MSSSLPFQQVELRAGPRAFTGPRIRHNGDGAVGHVPENLRSCVFRPRRRPPPGCRRRDPSKEASREAGALQTAIFNSVNFSSIATDANGVIQIFNVGAERMLGYTAAEVINRITRQTFPIRRK